jgi:hypothetical protein
MNTRQEGFDAYFELWTVRDNPYNPEVENEEYANWFFGWCNAEIEEKFKDVEDVFL